MVVAFASLSLSHTHRHTLSLSRCHTHTYSRTLSLSLSLSLSRCHTHTYKRTLSLFLSLSLSLTLRIQIRTSRKIQLIHLCLRIPPSFAFILLYWASSFSFPSRPSHVLLLLWLKCKFLEAAWPSLKGQQYSSSASLILLS